MTAVDTTVSLSNTQIAGLRAAGVTAVSRYIAPQAWKRITPAEYGRIIAGGLQVSLNWESGPQDLKALGVAATTSYAQEAVQQAHACGYPAGCVILNSADWDVTSGDWPKVAANLRAIRTVYRAAGYGLGLYAPWDALAWAERDGLVDVYWQAGMSTSWSHAGIPSSVKNGRNANLWPGAHLRQRRNAVIAGVDCDTNDILLAAFGQAGAGNTPHPPTGADMEQTDVLIRGTGLAARVVGDVFADLQNLRNFLYAKPGATGLTNPPPDGSVAVLLSHLAANPPAGTAPSQDQVTAAVKAALTDPAVLAALAQLIQPAPSPAPATVTDASIVADVQQALRAGTGA